jgi:hypothetical protein
LVVNKINFWTVILQATEKPNGIKKNQLGLPEQKKKGSAGTGPRDL